MGLENVLKWWEGRKIKNVKINSLEDYSKYCLNFGVKSIDAYLQPEKTDEGTKIYFQYLCATKRRNVLEHIREVGTIPEGEEFSAKAIANEERRNYQRLQGIFFFKDIRLVIQNQYKVKTLSGRYLELTIN